MESVAWTVKGYVGGELVKEETVHSIASSGLLSCRMCGVLWAPTWRSGGKRLNEAGDIVGYRLVARYKGQARELIAERAA